MKRFKFPYLLALICLLVFVGCNETDPVCPDRQTFDFKLNLRKTDSTTMRLKFYNRLDSIASVDSLPTNVSIPVDLNADSTTFFIDYINDTLPTVTDTITFSYKRITYLTDQECGFVMRFELDSLAFFRTKNKIDSIAWLNTNIDIKYEGNVEIYY